MPLVTADNPDVRLQPLCTIYVSPIYMIFDDHCPKVYFRYYMRRKMGPPGGAVCSYVPTLPGPAPGARPWWKAPNLALCPRFDGPIELGFVGNMTG